MAIENKTEETPFIIEGLNKTNLAEMLSSLSNSPPFDISYFMENVRKYKVLEPHNEGIASVLFFKLEHYGISVSPQRCAVIRPKIYSSPMGNYSQGGNAKMDPPRRFVVDYQQSPLSGIVSTKNLSDLINGRS